MGDDHTEVSRRIRSVQAARKHSDPEHVETFAGRGAGPDAVLGVWVAGGDVARQDQVVDHADEGEAEHFRPVRDGDQAVPLGQPALRADVDAEIHVLASAPLAPARLAPACRRRILW